MTEWAAAPQGPGDNGKQEAEQGAHSEALRSCLAFSRGLEGACCALQAEGETGGEEGLCFSLGTGVVLVLGPLPSLLCHPWPCPACQRGGL